MSQLETTKRTSDEDQPSPQSIKKAAVGADVPVPACPADDKKHPPTRRGVITNVVVESVDRFAENVAKCTGAKEYFRFPDENGKIMHLALDIGDVAMYLEEYGNAFYHGTEQHHVRLHLNVADPLALSEKLVKAGAKVVNKCEKQFWGATMGVFEDPWGVTWGVSDSTNTIEDVPKDLERKVVPFVSLKDAAGFLKFLSDVFGAEPVTEAAKDPSGKIMCAEMRVNGGLLMVADHCGKDEGRTDVAITLSHEVATGQAAPVCNAFVAEGGDMIDPPAMQFWGQVWGRCKDKFGQSWGIDEPQVGPSKTNEDMALDMKLGDKYKWRWSWSEVDAPKMYCFGEVRTCPAKGPELESAMETMLPAAFAEASKKGMEIVGPPLSAYYTWDPKEGGNTRFTTGAMVAGDDSINEAGEEDNGLGIRSVGGVRCVTTVHTGPYDELIQCYEATMDWVEMKGFESKMPSVELYENDPKDTEPAKLRTKVFVPIVPKAGGDGKKVDGCKEGTK